MASRNYSQRIVSRRISILWYSISKYFSRDIFWYVYKRHIPYFNMQIDCVINIAAHRIRTEHVTPRHCGRLECLRDKLMTLSGPEWSSRPSFSHLAQKWVTVSLNSVISNFINSSLYHTPWKGNYGRRSVKRRIANFIIQ